MLMLINLEKKSRITKIPDHFNTFGCASINSIFMLIIYKIIQIQKNLRRSCLWAEPICFAPIKSDLIFKVCLSLLSGLVG